VARLIATCCKPHFRVEIVNDVNVYLLGEYATHALTGRLYCQIIPLLNGQYTREEIIQKLNGLPPEHFDYVLDRLNAKGYLTDAAHNLTRVAAAFWSLLNVEPQVVSDRLPQTQVFVTAVGTVDAQPLIESLQAIGISVGRWGDGETGKVKSGRSSLRVVLTDDYQQPELSQIFLAIASG